MAGGGGLLTASLSQAQSSAELGVALRSVLASPNEGFSTIVRAAEMRSSAGLKPAEGVTPYALGWLGGAALMALWLKFGGLIGVRDVHAAQFGWSALIAALVFGGLVAVAVQIAWSTVGALLVRRLGGASSASARDLRLVWGAAALPQLIAVFVLLPLDVLFLGRGSFTSDRLVDPLATVWAATSIALAFSLAAWSVWLFVTGVKTTSDLDTTRAIGVAASALVALAAITTVLVVAAKLLASASS
ncbi:MAG: hypothetical protein QOF16_1508 [Actinomycetota bacterium]|nr:hypothetical protein [Actinomycetota bacterium]MEA2487854.1 hypothetical protein [Actinomycetota bacterium]